MFCRRFLDITRTEPIHYSIHHSLVDKNHSCCWYQCISTGSQAFDKGMPQQASPPLCPGARGQFLDLDIVQRVASTNLQCMAPEPLKSIWYFVVKLSCQFAHMHIFFRTPCDNIFVDLRSMVIKTNAKEGEIQKTSAVQTSTKPLQRFEKP